MDSTTIHYCYKATTIIYLTLGKKLMTGEWQMTDNLDLTMGIHALLIIHHTAASHIVLESTVS